MVSRTSVDSDIITSQQEWESDNDVLNPRLTLNGTEYVPFDDNATAAKFCTSATGKSLIGGKLTQADAWVWNGVPNDSLKWDGQNWVVAKSLNYVRRIQCQK